jgi:hypothetical protein
MILGTIGGGGFAYQMMLHDKFGSMQGRPIARAANSADSPTAHAGALQDLAGDSEFHHPRLEERTGAR